MRLIKALLITSFILLAGCTLSRAASQPPPQSLDWLTGCWQSENGSTREVWSRSEDGFFFGYSVVLNEEKVVFFEQMRIDPGEMPTFQAYPRGAGPSGFPAISVTETGVTFANPEHDYPQKIIYTRDGDALKAVISLIDDTRRGHFNYVACETDGS